MRISGRQPFTGETRTKVDHGECGHNVTLQVFCDSDDKTDRCCSVAQSKVIFFLFANFVLTNLITKSQLSCIRCPLTRERTQKKKFQSSLLYKCLRPLTRECLLTGMCK